MKQDRSVLSTQLLLTTALALAGAINFASAQTPRPAEAVSARAFSSSIEWSPQVANNGASLSVRGRSFRFEKSFDAGQNPRFALSDVEGGNLPDGVYNWELRFNLVNPTMIDSENNGRGGSRVNASRNGVVKSGDKTPDPTVVSGSFTVLSGNIVDPNAIEPGSGQN